MLEKCNCWLSQIIISAPNSRLLNWICSHKDTEATKSQVQCLILFNKYRHLYNVCLLLTSCACSSLSPSNPPPPLHQFLLHLFSQLSIKILAKNECAHLMPLFYLIVQCQILERFLCNSHMAFLYIFFVLLKIFCNECLALWKTTKKKKLHILVCVHTL